MTLKEHVCRHCGRGWRAPASNDERCPRCRMKPAEVIVPLLDPDHDEKTEPSDWNALKLDGEGFPF